MGHPIQNGVKLVLKVIIIKVSLECDKDRGAFLFAMWILRPIQATVSMITAHVISVLQSGVVLCAQSDPMRTCTPGDLRWAGLLRHGPFQKRKMSGLLGLSCC